MYREERLRMILDIISKEKTIVVQDLAERFNLSPASIRLDLAELHDLGLVHRTHGGAIIPSETQSIFIFDNTNLKQHDKNHIEEKRKIAEAVVDLIHDGDIVMIDGGSTNHLIARQLGRKNGLTIITPSVYLLSILSQNTNGNIFLTGGLYVSKFYDFVGEMCLENIERFNPDVAIIGIDGVSVQQGLTLMEPATEQVKRKMISVSKNLIIPADSSKVGKTFPIHIVEINKINTLVTDSNISTEDANAFREIGLKVIIA